MQRKLKSHLVLPLYIYVTYENKIGSNKKKKGKKKKRSP